jgi:hypothetical protein
MAEAEPGSGNIEFELDGESMVLVPTLQACIDISNIAGGLDAARVRCQQLDFDTICRVIIAGLTLNPRQAKMIPDAVYKTGLIQLHGVCIDFIHVVGNGGRPLPEEEPDEEPDPPKPA